MPKIAVIGATSWGITLSLMLAKKGLRVALWARTAQEAQELRQTDLHSCGHHHYELPPGKIPFGLSITDDPAEAMSRAQAAILTVTSQTMRQNIRIIKDYLGQSMLIASATKGFEIGTNLRMSQVITEEIDPKLLPNICVISGPNLAKEIVTSLPAATIVAAENPDVSRAMQRYLSTPNLCVFTHNDVIGVELGGALKNIIALGAGMADGLSYGDNAKAAFMTRGLTEISALGVALGANPLTFSGLAGLGDVIATCASKLSRNHYFGEQLAKGRKTEDILQSMTEVAEGVPTTKAAWELAQHKGLEMPITEKIYRVLYDGLSPKEAGAELLGIPVDHELNGRKWKLFSFLKRQKRS